MAQSRRCWVAPGVILWVRQEIARKVQSLQEMLERGKPGPKKRAVMVLGCVSSVMGPITTEAWAGEQTFQGKKHQLASRAERGWGRLPQGGPDLPRTRTKLDKACAWASLSAEGDNSCPERRFLSLQQRRAWMGPWGVGRIGRRGHYWMLWIMQK